MKRLVPVFTLLAACPDGGGGPPPGPRLEVWFAAEEGQNPVLVDVEPEPY